MNQMVIKPAWEPGDPEDYYRHDGASAVKAGFYEKMPDEKIIYAP